MTGSDLTQEQLIDIYARTRTIAVVGASADPDKAAHRIPRYLHEQGYRIIPVNPRGGALFGEAVHASLAEISDRIDVVDVFRPPDQATSIARQAVSSGARVLWFQPDTQTDEAVRIAADAGITVVTDRCMGATHARLGLGRQMPDRSHAGGGSAGRRGPAA